MTSVVGIIISYVSRDPWLLTRLDREADTDVCGRTLPGSVH